MGLFRTHATEAWSQRRRRLFCHGRRRSPDQEVSHLSQDLQKEARPWSATASTVRCTEHPPSSHHGRALQQRSEVGKRARITGRIPLPRKERWIAAGAGNVLGSCYHDVSISFPSESGRGPFGQLHFPNAVVAMPLSRTTHLEWMGLPSYLSSQDWWLWHIWYALVLMSRVVCDLVRTHIWEGGRHDSMYCHRKRQEILALSLKWRD
jgi:hypothetical protein